MSQRTRRPAGDSPSPKKQRLSQESSQLSKDDQYLFWESTSQEENSGAEIHQIVNTLHHQTSPRGQSRRVFSLLREWETEQKGRTKRRQSRESLFSSSFDYPNTRTQSSPLLAADKELQELLVGLQDASQCQSPVRKSRLQEWTMSHADLLSPNPRVRPRETTFVQKKREYEYQREIAVLESLMQEDEFEEDIFKPSLSRSSLSLPQSLNSEEPSADLADDPSSGTETDETDSDVENIEMETSVEPHEGRSHPLFGTDLGERTKTRDFFPPMKDYQPPLRCLILDITETSDAPHRPQKVLLGFDENRLLEKRIVLQGRWYDTPVHVGDYVNIISWSMSHQTLLETPRILIDDSKDALLLHPDILVPVKEIGASLRCMRQSILSQRIRSSSVVTEHIFKGEIIHSLFERALLRKNFTQPFLESHLAELLSDNLVKIHLLEKDVDYFLRLIRPSLASLQAWASSNLSDAVVSNARSTSMIALNHSMVKSIRKVIAVEESIWSPTYGIKGKIDATVVYQSPSFHATTQSWRTDPPSTSVPLELKTGKLRNNRGSIADRAQVALYSLLFSERNQSESQSQGTPHFPEGLLCYINQDNKSQIVVPTSLAEIQGLIQQRNEMVSYLSQEDSFPPQIGDQMACQYCHHQSACYVVHKTHEGGTPQTAAISKYWEQHASHLTPTHVNFSRRWSQFISWEAQCMKKSFHAIWNFPSHHLQEQGSCAGQLKLVSSQRYKYPTPMSSMEAQPSSQTENDKPSEIMSSQGFLYRFQSAAHPSDSSSSSATRPSRTFTSAFLPSPVPEKTFLELSLSVGDFILLSTEHGHFGVRQGTIQRIRAHSIEVLLHEPLQAPYHLPSAFPRPPSQSQDGLVDVEDLVASTSSVGLHSTLWRIDKMESMSTFSRMRHNLMRLMQREKHLRLRELIVDLVAPTSAPADAPCDEFILTWSQQCPSIGDLNAHQRQAIKHVLAANDYSLILGMPGTGKTTTIAHIVAALIQKKKRVLLTSYTHSAVDTVLLKLIDLEIPFLRLGASHRVHPRVQPYTLQSYQSLASLHESLDIPVIATTCLGVNDIVMNTLHFDYCIVDEASQISLPVCLGPLFLAEKFVLVGDHYQLPPIVKSPEAIKADYESLFKLLSEKHPASVVHLGIQYRMNAEIMGISNHLVYNHRLRCGATEVAQGRLALPWLHKLPSPVHSSEHWMLYVLLAERPVVFVDLDQVPALESLQDHLVTNEVEARITAMIARGLILAGVSASEVGIISPYRSQLRAIRRYTHQLGGMNDVDVLTVDKYQGRDKEAILFSLVRSNAKQKVGDLLEDWRRANVAFTRARKKLIILGSASTLEGNHFFKLFLRYAKERDWIYSLPNAAHKSYPLRSFSDGSFSSLSQLWMDD